MNEIPVAPCNVSRRQFSLGDLYFFVALAAIGIFAITPLAVHVFGFQSENQRLVTALAVLALGLFGGLIGFLRAQKQPWPECELRLYVIVYALLAWIVAPLVWWLGLGWTLCAIALSLPGLLWACLHIERCRYDDFRRELTFAGGILINWFILFVISALLIPNMVCSRIGYNESTGIAACKTYAEAQDIYHRTDWDSDGVLEYAQTISGANSLYEKTEGNSDLTLVDAAFAVASEPIHGQPKAGYYFKVLTGQGPHARGGRKSYLTIGADGNFNLTQGYALLAWPAVYDERGRNSFQINNTGTVYQKDLGPNTANIAAAMTEYDPGPGWVVSE